MKNVEALTSIQGIGPKRVEALHEALGIRTLDDLEQAATDGRIAEVEGFGPTLQQRILDHIGMARADQERRLLGRAFPIVEDLIAELTQSRAFSRLEPVGSFRRRLPTVGDVDLLAIAPDPEAAMEAFTGLDDVEAVLSQEEREASVILTSHLQVDLCVVDEAVWGSALISFTGSEDHTSQLDGLAQDNGWRLDQHGLFDGEERLAGATEADVYRRLGMATIPAEMREATGEVELAQADELPRLVELGDIKGDLQMHTTWSDGHASILEMAKKAQALWYDYILITDHGPSLEAAGGPSQDQLPTIREEIDKVQGEVDVDIKLGIEANIQEDGGLDISDEACQALDLVVASLHTQAKDATDRIGTAIEEHPVDILAYPTDRLFGKRDPNDLDLDRLCQVAADNHVALEINAQPDRLDLDWRHVQEHRDEVKWVISSDAHTTGHLETMRLGVFQARKGWLTRDHVLNTGSWKTLQGYLRG